MPNTILARPAATDHHEYYSKYVGCVPAGDLVGIATTQIAELRALLGGLSAEQSRYRYAPGKWSIREVIGHLTDTERVFSYRAAAFSRSDTKPLPGFEQDEWLPHGRYDERDLADLLDEWEATRRSLIALMRGTPEAALNSRGMASGFEFTALAAMTIAVGHAGYHVEGLRRDYLGS